MSWLFESRRIETERNGPMLLTRILGRWILRTPDWTQQSSPYIDAMWRKALRAVGKRGTPAKNCLVLGVGLGGVIGLVRAAYPDAEITGVDWDAELADMGRVLGTFKTDAGIRFAAGDAATVVPGLDGGFDLAVIDMFVGRDPAPVLFDDGFQDVLVRKLAPGGVVCLNGYNQTGVFEGWKARMDPERIVHYQMNEVLILSKRLQQ